MGKKIALQTLGCRLNQHESDALAAKFQSANYEIVTFDSDLADVYVINTCSVTSKSDRKSRNLVNRARRNEKALVVVTGCYANNDRNTLEEDGLTIVVGNDQKAHIFEIVDSFFRGEVVLSNNLVADRFGFNNDVNALHTRGIIKIHDGCNNHCTYCIIPQVRGNAISRSTQEILDQASRLIANGFKEIVLTGINISRYNFEGVNFALLLEKLVALSGDFRIHIPSMEPENIDDKFIELLENEKICRHIHLCLQSGSDRILKLMGRKYTVASYRENVQKIRAKFPNFNITTDIIVGFPGESDEDFEQTLDLVAELKFGHVHTFKYSQREGTAAVKLKGQISESLKSERSERLRLLSEQQRDIYRKSLLGLEQKVLIEQIREGCGYGYSEFYVPFKLTNCSALLQNRFVQIVPNELCEESDESVLSARI